jgi:hypothetical protein
MLTRQQVQLLEECWEVLDKLRNCADFQPESRFNYWGCLLRIERFFGLES